MKKGERRKQELLKIAYRMFIEKGYENTSIDEIINEAGIAKGTYYYYFESKEATLEAVIDMMIEEEVGRAKEVLAASMPVPRKLVSVIYSLRPVQDEQVIAKALDVKENIVMHEKTNRRIVEEAVPLLTEVVKEGISQEIFNCTNIEERVKMLLIMSQQMFDDGIFTDRDVEVYVDMVEKALGAKSGTMSFIVELIGRPPRRGISRTKCEMPPRRGASNGVALKKDIRRE
ncbi:MAG: TetR/AcrR family transcriptional regulator [Lachnospiraceae bacterium]|nr:TetR/AcrR family transcriptional regulator [Lachnospiraceae bacterium]